MVIRGLANLLVSLILEKLIEVMTLLRILVGILTGVRLPVVVGALKESALIKVLMCLPRLPRALTEV